MSIPTNSVLTILGCGTSTGVPLPGCTCAVCLSDNKKNNRTRTSAWILQDDGTSIVIDSGPDFRQQALREGIAYIDAVFYTHGHADHILGLDDLRCYNFVQNEVIPCYGTAPTLAAIKRFFHYIFNPDPNYKGGKLAQLHLHEIEPSKSFSFKNQKIQAIPLEHGDMPVTAFRLGDLGYATDFKHIEQDSLSLLSGVKHLVLDGLRHKSHHTHLTIKEAITLSEQLQVENTYLTHMSHDVDYESDSQSLPQGVQFAYDGLKIPFYAPGGDLSAKKQA